MQQLSVQEGVSNGRPDAGSEIAVALDPPGLPRDEGQGRVGGIDPSSAFQHGYHRRVTGVACHDLIRTRLRDDRHTARRGDAIGIAVHHVTHAKEHGALQFGRLQRTVVQYVDIEFRGLVERQMR